ncbi:MAG: hypothetical protein GY750_06415 [Lentisphaerae bacterium]|nr:hypothetical protein [Lentisphaerota bacterium]
MQKQIENALYDLDSTISFGGKGQKTEGWGSHMDRQPTSLTAPSSVSKEQKLGEDIALAAVQGGIPGGFDDIVTGAIEIGSQVGGYYSSR